MNEKVILLVEDNADDAALALDAFRACRFASRIDVEPDGVAALEYLFGSRAKAAPPSLVLLDLKLPKIDGFTVLRRIRADARTRCVPVVVLTTSKEHRDIVASYDLGANSYVRKPVDFDRFTAALREIGAYWLLLNETPPARAENQEE